MNKEYFIDIHTHQFNPDKEVLSILNVFPEDITEKTLAFSPVSISLHPWYFTEFPANDIKKIKHYSSKPEVVAIGEFGFDKLRGHALDVQLSVFKEMAEISEEVDKVCIIHCVKATDLLLNIRKNQSYRMPWIFHRFTGNLYEAQQLIASGIYLSFGENLLKNNRLQQVFKQIPLSAVFFETDDQNSTIQEIYDFASRLRSVSLSELKSEIQRNFEIIFRR
ncbi:MAG TPA: TatD family hydrolase [Bacteroidia bacterium]|nr:TatD family hydrolase [Bacteroidia bacterium]HRS58699.1 TatD family hydrolase [Bacteroidia bacterium]HRU69340.1 TatD family hydrolase [Bacteroidia bacterium]